MTTLDNAALCHCTKLRRAARHISRFYDAHLASSGLRMTQYSILGYLKYRGSKSMLELANEMTMDRATIGHNLRPLERDGLVLIEVSHKDRRVKIVSVTQAGLGRLALGLPGWERAQAELETELGAGNAVAIRDMLDHVIACDLKPEMSTPF